MPDVIERLRELFRDETRLKDLFLLEKERRGFPLDKLVFIGMRNVAHYYWCAMDAIFRSRSRELEFFSAYLNDRILYSYRLGLIKTLPKDPEVILGVGDDVTLEDIERLLKKKIKHTKEEETRGTMGRIVSVESITDSGERVVVVNPDLPLDERQWLEEIARDREDTPLAELGEHPMNSGRLLEQMKAERHPSIRWNYEWDDYIVVGIPDGITDKIVYEYKTTRNKFLMYFAKPVALIQADLYGYFFGRDTKRVQMYIVEEDDTQTWEQAVDKTKVENVLKNFKRVDEGWLPPPPKSWKCNKCEFLAGCAVSPLN